MAQPITPKSPASRTSEIGAKVSLDKLYGNREQLLCIFRVFDTERSGTISKAEFKKGVKVLRKNRPSHSLPSADALWKLLDIECDNEIHVNDFLEVFRVVD